MFFAWPAYWGLWMVNVPVTVITIAYFVVVIVVLYPMVEKMI